jgi:hypothetical protein
LATATATLGIALLISLGFAQTDLPPSVILLSKIKSKAAQDFGELPSFTCLETISRAERRSSSASLRFLDAVRLEVAQAGGRELFSWPGDRKFTDHRPKQIIGIGLTSTGEFTSHVQTVLLGRNAQIQYAGEEDLHGKMAARYDYSVASFVSGYRMSVRGQSAIVATRGVFWADRNTLELLRLTVEAVDIPPELGVRSATTQIEYAPVRMGAQRILLPQSASLVMIDRDGSESRNETTFTHCRRFIADSAISFSDAPATGAASAGTRAALDDVTVPPGSKFAIRLRKPIDSTITVIGDPIEAILQNDVSQKGQIIVSKGSVISGRVRMLEHYTTPKEYFVVGLEFTELAFDHHSARFWAWLQSHDQIVGLAEAFSKERTTSLGLPRGRRLETTDTETYRPAKLPGVGVFLLEGNRFLLPAGFAMDWQSLPYRSN